MAQEAAPKGMTNRKLRRLLAHNRSSNCAAAKIGDSAQSYLAVNRKRAPRRRGPAAILDIDDTDVAAEYQGQTPEVARHRQRRQVGRGDVAEANWGPTAENLGTLDAMPSVASGKSLGTDMSAPQQGDPI